MCIMSPLADTVVPIQCGTVLSSTVKAEYFVNYFEGFLYSELLVIYSSMVVQLLLIVICFSPSFPQLEAAVQQPSPRFTLLASWLCHIFLHGLYSLHFYYLYGLCKQQGTWWILCSCFSQFRNWWCTWPIVCRHSPLIQGTVYYIIETIIL